MHTIFFYRISLFNSLHVESLEMLENDLLWDLGTCKNKGIDYIERGHTRSKSHVASTMGNSVHAQYYIPACTLELTHASQSNDSKP